LRVASLGWGTASHLFVGENDEHQLQALLQAQLVLVRMKNRSYFGIATDVNAAPRNAGIGM
jgi:hypothetical protein